MIAVDVLLGDPDFVQPLTIYRRTRTVGTDGVVRTVPVLVTPAPLGSIQVGANPELVRKPDFATSNDRITIYTAFRLVGDGAMTSTDSDPEATAATDLYGNAVTPQVTAQWSADIVVFHGDAYEVFRVNDWSDYGAGFISASARRISTAPTALVAS